MTPRTNQATSALDRQRSLSRQVVVGAVDDVAKKALATSPRCHRFPTATTESSPAHGQCGWANSLTRNRTVPLGNPVRVWESLAVPKKASVGKIAVHRVKGGAAPRPLAKTRSGNPRRKPTPITIRRADGSTEVVTPHEFAARHGEPSWSAVNREFKDLLRAYREGRAATVQLRAFAENYGLESRLERALTEGAGGGRVDDLAPLSSPAIAIRPTPKRSRARKRK